MDESHPQVTRGPARGLSNVACAAVLIGLFSGCSGEGGKIDADSDGAGGDNVGGEGNATPVYSPDLPYARSLESFEPGVDAGFNQQKLPGIVLGPPGGVVSGGGSLDVVSLGAGGSIVLGFGNKAIVDAAGTDFVVFENPFWPGGDASQVYAELGEVSVSEDGETWQTFPCDTTGDGQGRFTGCAGFTPTQKYDPATLVPLDPARTGGDAFDLAELGVARARFVKIRDLETLEPGGTSAGFDLDAVGIVNVEE
jgi:hypothetical protein